MEKLKEKYGHLTERKNALSVRLIRLQSHQESVQRELAQAKKEAKKNFGTDNLEELRSLYKKRSDQAQSELASFENGLNELEKALDSIDEKLRSINV